MEVEFLEQEEKILRYSDIRTSRLFTWWNGGEKINQDAIFIKGITGYTQLSTGDFFLVSPLFAKRNPRVLRVRAKLVVESVEG